MKNFLDKITTRAFLKIGLLPGMIGAAAMIAQVAYLRLVAQSFYGNELTMCIALGHWLVWTGIGSLLGTRFIRQDFKEKHLLRLTVLYSLVLIVFAGLLYLNRSIARIPTGEIVGLGTIFSWTMLFFSLPALLNGFFFPLIVDWNRKQEMGAPVHTVYAAEVIGSALGSLLFAGLILAGVGTINCLLVIVWLMLTTAFYLFLRNNGYRSLAVATTFIVIVTVMIIFQNQLAVFKWRPFQLVKHRESPYSALTILRYNAALSLYSDSQPLWTFGEREHAEELTHFALLNHPSPQTVLVIGVGNAEIKDEILRHSTVRKITIVQPDRIAQEMLNQSAVLTDTLTRIVIADPLRFLRRTDEHFDVVLLNIPLPVNAQWNRFYTHEFFTAVRRCIGVNGLLMLNFPGDEEYLTTAHIDFLKIIQNTVQNVFRETVWIPGLTTHLLAADFPLTNDLHYLIGEQKRRDLAPLYVGEYFLTDRLSPWKINFLTNKIASSPVVNVNTLAQPAGYYFDTTLWGQRTGGFTRWIYPFFRMIGLIPVLIGFTIVLLLIEIILWKKTTGRLTIRMAGIGFWVMGLESVTIILFQSLVGSVYLWIVFLTFAYMLGAGWGAIVEMKRKRTKSEIPHFIIVLMLLQPVGCLRLLQWYWPVWLVTVLIGLILLTGGLLAGYLFPLLVQIYIEESNNVKGWSGRKLTPHGAGHLYAADILGSALGVYLISGIVIPIWGILPALGMIMIIPLMALLFPTL